MTQGELFAQTLTRSAAAAPSPIDVRKRLEADLGLWVDPFTADYIARTLERGEAEVRFIAADARSGRSAFHVMPAKMLRGE